MSEVRILAVGDLSYNGRYHQLSKANGADYVLRAVAARWSGADLRLANLESPLTSHGRVAPAKLTLRGAPEAIKALQHARFDCLSVANNHMMDFGPAGLAETCDRLCKAGILFVGAGRSEQEACSPVVLNRRGQSIGILAFCDVEQKSPLYAGENQPGVAYGRLETCLRAVQELRPSVDWVIVHLHWGMEMARLPSPEQKEMARELVAAGVDVLLGHHPHVLQPVERIDKALVAYSLGNFVFSDMYWRGMADNGDGFLCKFRIHPLARRTGWLEIVLRQDAAAEYRFHPAFLRRDLTVVPDGRAKRRRQWAGLQRMMRAKNYPQAYETEARRAAETASRQMGGRSLAMRIENRLCAYGLIPGAFVEC